MKANPKASRGKALNSRECYTAKRSHLKEALDVPAQGHSFGDAKGYLPAMVCFPYPWEQPEVTESQLCHAVHVPSRYEFSFFLLICWSAQLTAVRHLGESPGPGLATQQLEAGSAACPSLISRLDVSVLSGWNKGRERGWKGRCKSPCFAATVGASSIG